jgi:heme A synthase
VGFQRLCLVTCAVIFGLIILGGVVRATDSGLGCGDHWPRCEGSFIPRFEKELLIEYSHRLTASIAGFLVLGIFVWAWRSCRQTPVILYGSTLAFILLLFQAGLGAAAVRNELSPRIVAVHLGTAVTILSLLLVVTTAAIAQSRPLTTPRAGRQFGQVALLALALAFPLLLVGSYVSGASYGLACSGWPLCNGEVIPTAGGASVQLHFFHRLLALTLGLVLLALAWLGWRARREAPFAAAVSALALAVYCAQALIGAANIWTDLADEVTAAHLAGATSLWVVLAVLNTRVHRLHELRFASARAPRSGLAGQPR